VSFSRSLLVLAAACAGCGGPPAPVRPPNVVKVAPVTQAPPVVPAQALGAYHGGDGFFVQLEQLGQRLFLIVPDRRAVVMQVEKTATAIRLVAPAQLMNAPEDEPQLPNAFSLVAPAPGHPHWRLESPVGTLTQRPNALAAELATNLGGRELVGVNDKGVRTRAELQHYLRLLREEPAKELQDIVSSNDPDSLQAQGGVRGYLCNALGFALGELEPAAAGTEQARLREYAETTRKAAQGGPLWPRSDDAFLFDLADRQLLTKDTLVFSEGKLLSMANKDEKGVATCDLAVIVPEPTENRGRPWRPFARPAPGQLGSFSYVGLVLQSGPPGSCNSLEPGRGMYPVRHGIYFFRLLADSRAEPQGALFLGYMAASLFVTPDIARKDLAKAIHVMSEEVSRQAE
jgi:hypothetical protein